MRKLHLVGLVALVLAHESISASPQSKEKVAVIVSAGDLDVLEDPMKEVERQAVRTYENLGYKVIIVGGVNRKHSELSPEVVRSTISGLKGVKDLRLDFIGHGGIAKLPAQGPGPAGITVSSERRSQMGP